MRTDPNSELIWSSDACSVIQLPCRTKGFRDFFQSLNQITFPDTSRKPLKADVIQVAEQNTSLDPVVETVEAQKMINDHNAQLPPMARHLEMKRKVFFTGYLISAADTAKLLDLVKVPPNMAEPEIKYLANSMLIAPRPADQSILAKVGGIGSKQTWQVTGFSFFQSNIWAVRVAPVPPLSSVYTIHHTPLIVLATYKNTKPDLANSIKTWQPVPVDKQYILQSEVGEKVQLRIEASDEGDSGSHLERRGMKRRNSPSGLTRNGLNQDENRRQYHTSVNNKANNLHRNKVPSSTVSGPRAAQGRGGRARQKGPKPGWGYRSLDEVTPSQPRYGTQRGDPNYDDFNSGADHGSSIKDTAAGLPYGQ